MNIFGCELDPTSAVSDFYTFGGGGAGQPDSQTPSTKSIGDNVANSSVILLLLKRNLCRTSFKSRRR